jgi:NAD-dependent dihydropyrimidine dehydrogenase PreA subunit
MRVWVYDGGVMSMLRKIVHIDEDECNGCGQCVSSCAEGAIQVIDGKARLVSEVYCDGLGACLSECPQGAISIEERDVEAFDAESVHRYLTGRPAPKAPQMAPVPHPCPGSMSQALRRNDPATAAASAMPDEATPSLLGNWPVQLSLVPVRVDSARLCIAADCVPFAFADFHRRFLDGRTLMIGCPKLDDVDLYRHKLAQIFLQNDIQSIDIIYMEVPCCFGLVHLVRLAIQQSGKDIPLQATKIGIRGNVCEAVTT